MGLTEQSTSTLATEIKDHFLCEAYQASIDSGELAADPFQKIVVDELQTVFNTLLVPHTPPPKKRGRFGKLFSLPNKKPTVRPIRKGLYLWGGVGRGKTHMVDYFYKLIPTDKKLRLHFHRFMQVVHEDLAMLKHVADPLEEVANNLAAKTDIICLDEMHVNDITDAMLLGKLFEHLFNKGVILVTTSNRVPSDLYKDGLQRDRFLPAIALLEKYTKVVQMGGDEDYRLRTLEQNGVYHLSSESSNQDELLQNYFHELSGIELHDGRTDITIRHRSIPVKMWADGVVWFTFDSLCNTARSSDDYIEIASFFHTVLISNIPVMEKSMDDAARRFVNMIDEFYDLHVNLVVSADAEPESLYTGDRLEFEFERTASRLREMQSKDYMTIKHLS